jgi:hypothetical protein
MGDVADNARLEHMGIECRAIAAHGDFFFRTTFEIFGAETGQPPHRHGPQVANGLGSGKIAPRVKSTRRGRRLGGHGWAGEKTHRIRPLTLNRGSLYDPAIIFSPDLIVTVEKKVLHSP